MGKTSIFDFSRDHGVLFLLYFLVLPAAAIVAITILGVYVYDALASYEQKLSRYGLGCYSAKIPFFGHHDDRPRFFDYTVGGDSPEDFVREVVRPIIAKRIEISQAKILIGNAASKISYGEGATDIYLESGRTHDSAMVSHTYYAVSISAAKNTLKRSFKNYLDRLIIITH